LLSIVSKEFISEPPIGGSLDFEMPSVGFHSARHSSPRRESPLPSILEITPGKIDLNSPRMFKESFFIWGQVWGQHRVSSIY
jgi:hypothetical protein